MGKGKTYIVRTTYHQKGRSFIKSYYDCSSGLCKNKREAAISAFRAARFNNDFTGLVYESSKARVHREWIYCIVPRIKSLITGSLIKVDAPFVFGVWYFFGIKKNYSELTDEQKKSL